MDFVRIPPPGTWCHHQAVVEMLARCPGQTFLEAGCGAGDLSRILCKMGYEGIGLDFSEQALKLAQSNMSTEISEGRYRLIQSDIFDLPVDQIQVDVALSMMVMEHIEDDVAFAQALTRFVRPEGHVVIAVPGRRDHWGIEDETVGHYRRYDSSDLRKTLTAAGLTDVEVWSVAVPVANLLYRTGNLLLRRSQEIKKRSLSQQLQTETSGIQEIPFKTVFPRCFRLLLNRITMTPFFLLQRLFYHTNRGLTMMAVGRVEQGPA